MRNKKAKHINLDSDRELAIKTIVLYQIAQQQYDDECERLSNVRERNFSEYWELIKPAQSKRDNARRAYIRCAEEYEDSLVKELASFGTDPFKYAKANNLVEIPDGYVYCPNC